MKSLFLLVLVLIFTVACSTCGCGHHPKCGDKGSGQEMGCMHKDGQGPQCMKDHPKMDKKKVAPKEEMQTKPEEEKK